MTTLRQAAEQALEALDALAYWDGAIAKPAIDALRQALEAEQRYEPVAIVERHGIVADVEWLPASCALRNGDKLYTHPQPAQQPLPEKQIDTIWQHACREHFSGLQREIYLARLIERAHGIGGAA